MTDNINLALVKNDLNKLSDDDKAAYYLALCHSMGLNPASRPFEFLTLSGKMVLYAKKDCTDQLRKIHGVSIEIVKQELLGDTYTVHVKATDSSGRIDEDMGSCPLPETMKGEARSNQLMKTLTKAKRRVTLSICGLGMLDESEVSSIPRAEPQPTLTAQLLESALSAAQTPEQLQAVAEEIKRLPEAEQKPFRMTYVAKRKELAQ